MGSFTTLWIYTILKLSAEVSAHQARFTTLWIYTILKRYFFLCVLFFCFTTLWIYTILKLDFTKKQKTPVSLPYGFTLFSNQGLNVYEWDPFHYLMDLHYSQTQLLLHSL